MLCLFFYLLFILGIEGQTPDELKCDLPPLGIPNAEVQILNYQLVKGRRIFTRNDSITKAYSYDAWAICNPGFTLVGYNSISCIKGVIEGTPSCISTCEKFPDDDTILSCGMGYNTFESRCKIPSEGIAGLTVTASKPECGHLSSGALVVNGVAAKHGTVPWHVGIYTKTTRPYMQVCGGTLVRNNVVISAAHCFWSDIEKKLPAENYAVAAGKIFRPWNHVNDTDFATKSDVSEIRIPPRYRGGATNFQDDLAVLLLTTQLQVDNKNVVLACLDFDNTLDEKQLQDGTIGTVAGWGLTGADGPASQILNVVKLPIVDIEQCINGAEPSFLSSITSDKICAGYTNGTTVCRGDSGGGLALPEYSFEGDQYFLRGIVSTAPKSDHLCNVFAVATFTQIAKHEFFIKAALSDVEVVADTERPISGVIEDTQTNIMIGSLNKPEADIPPVNPLNSDINPVVNPNVTNIIGDRFNNKTDPLNINIDSTNSDANLNLDSGVNIPTNNPTEKPAFPDNGNGSDVDGEVSILSVNKPTKKPANKPIGRPPNSGATNADYDRPSLLMELYPNLFPHLYLYFNKTVNLSPVVTPTNNTDKKPDVADVLSDRFNNETNTLDINTAITNAPPTEKPTIIQDNINKTENEDSITPTLVSGVLPLTELTESVSKPMVSDLLPVNLALVPVAPTTETLETNPASSAPSEPVLLSDIPTLSVNSEQEPVLSTGNTNLKPVSSPTTSEPKPVLSAPSGSGIGDLVQGSVPNKPIPETPGFDHTPPDYNDWTYWHNNYQNWQNNPQNWHHHHNCHEHGHDNHPNWHYQSQNWQNYHQDKDYNQNWQNYPHDGHKNDQNGPYQYQNWQNDHQNRQNNHQTWPMNDKNANDQQQNWHNFLVKSWQSGSTNGFNPDQNQQNSPVDNKNGYPGNGK